MSMRPFLLLLLPVICFAVDETFDFESEANLTGAEEDFKSRLTSLSTTEVSYSMLKIKITAWNSSTFQGSSLNASVEEDSVIGYFSTGLSSFVSIPPFAISTYVPDSTDISLDSFFQGGGQSPEALGVIVAAITGIVEVDDQGDEVDCVTLSGSWTGPTEVSA